MTNYYASAPRGQENILALVDVLLQEKAAGGMGFDQPPPEPTAVETDCYRELREALERQRDQASRAHWLGNAGIPA